MSKDKKCVDRYDLCRSYYEQIPYFEEILKDTIVLSHLQAGVRKMLE